MLNALCDAASWAGDNLVAPVVTGVFVGVALRYSAISGEVTTHAEGVHELNADLARWVADRDRVLDADIYRAVNLANQGEIEDVVQPDPPEGVGGVPGNQFSSGAFLNRCERLMRQTLHEYRDQASGSVRTYRAMARSEGGLHDLSRSLRRRRKPVALVLSPTGREILATWRERVVPGEGERVVTVGNDPTRAEDAAEIAPLESDDGLAWDVARCDR